MTVRRTITSEETPLKYPKPSPSADLAGDVYDDNERKTESFRLYRGLVFLCLFGLLGITLPNNNSLRYLSGNLFGKVLFDANEQSSSISSDDKKNDGSGGGGGDSSERETWPFYTTMGIKPTDKNVQVLQRGAHGNVYTVLFTHLDKHFVYTSNWVPGQSPYNYRKVLGRLKMTVTEEDSLLCLYRFKLWWMRPYFVNHDNVEGESHGEYVPMETIFILGRDSDTDKGESVGGGEGKYRLVMTLLLPDGSGVTSGAFGSSEDTGRHDVITLSSETGGIVGFYSGLGNDPYELIREGVNMATTLAASPSSVAQQHQSGSGKYVNRLPKFAQHLGWCTWNAYYTNLTGPILLNGVETIHKADIPIRWMIMDDGWQATTDDKPTGDTPFRKKFRLVNLGSSPSKFGRDDDDDIPIGEGSGKEELLSLKETIARLKRPTSDGGKYGMKHVLAWHAISGYWLGIDPTSNTTVINTSSHEETNINLPPATILYPHFSSGLMENDPTLKDRFDIQLGVGIADDASAYFDRYHAYMSGVGIDGVKVDVQAVTGTLYPQTSPPDKQYVVAVEMENFVHRHSVAVRMHDALSKSVRTHFLPSQEGEDAMPILHCMCHAPEIFYRIPSLYFPSKERKKPLMRASDDFFPNEPKSHGRQIAACAYNSLIFGLVAVPDWDMFMTVLPPQEGEVDDVDTSEEKELFRYQVSKFHSMSRAISGGPIYISDVPGESNSTLMKATVCEDGTILVCSNVALPIRRHLLQDPFLHGEGREKEIVRPLIVWNTNGIPPCEEEDEKGGKMNEELVTSGVLGIFNLNIAPTSSHKQRRTTWGDDARNNDVGDIRDEKVPSPPVSWSYQRRSLSKDKGKAGGGSTVTLRPRDVETFARSQKYSNASFLAYSYESNSLQLLSDVDDTLSIEIPSSSSLWCDVVTMIPISNPLVVYTSNNKDEIEADVSYDVIPFGLLGKYNPSGAILRKEFHNVGHTNGGDEEDHVSVKPATLRLSVRGCGEFAIFLKRRKQRQGDGSSKCGNVSLHITVDGKSVSHEIHTQRHQHSRGIRRKDDEEGTLEAATGLMLPSQLNDLGMDVVTFLLPPTAAGPTDDADGDGSEKERWVEIEFVCMTLGFSSSGS